MYSHNVLLSILRNETVLSAARVRGEIQTTQMAPAAYNHI
jgi:hypothetical protein